MFLPIPRLSSFLALRRLARIDLLDPVDHHDVALDHEGTSGLGPSGHRCIRPRSGEEGSLCGYHGLSGDDNHGDDDHVRDHLPGHDHEDRGRSHVHGDLHHPLHLDDRGSHHHRHHSDYHPLPGGGKQRFRCRRKKEEPTWLTCVIAADHDSVDRDGLHHHVADKDHLCDDVPRHDHPNPRRFGLHPDVHHCFDRGVGDPDDVCGNADENGHDSIGEES